MRDDDRHDRDWLDVQQALRETVATEPFDKQGTRARIESTLASGTVALVRARTWPAVSRIAAAAALFLTGLWIGRSTPPHAAAVSPDWPPAVEVAASIQASGTEYVKAIARLRALEPVMDADTYQRHVEVAVGAFAAAARELGSADARAVSRLALQSVFEQGIALSATTTPAVMYR